MPLIGRIAVLIFAIITTIVAYSAALLRPRLQGREPCARWFAFLAGTLAAAAVFAIWTGMYGLGAAAPGPRGAAFGLFAGLVWGAIFSFVNSRILWIAFDPPRRDRSVEQRDMLDTDIGVLISRAVDHIRAFRPKPKFAATGALPWGIFVAAVALPVMWAYLFYLLTWLTEGAPGVEPVMPIRP